MMDANVQHRTAPMVIASISPAGSAGGSKSVSADTDDLNDNNVLTVHDTTPGAATTTTDGDDSPESGRKIVGKLILSKLPPSSRHLMSPADAIREANSRSLINYSATSSEETPHRSADVPVLKGIVLSCCLSFRPESGHAVAPDGHDGGQAIFARPFYRA